MSDLPKQIWINEEGPRVGFQIESTPIALSRKSDGIRLDLEALSRPLFIDPDLLWKITHFITPDSDLRVRLPKTCSGEGRRKALARH